MRKRLWLAASLLVVTALLVGGCAGHPKGMKSLRWLTDNEKDRVIEIALNTPEALKCLEKYDQYKTKLGWIAIWENSKAVGWQVFDYEVVETGIPRGGEPPPGVDVVVGVSESAVFYPEVLIRFGEPVQWLVMVAVDLDTEKVVLVEAYPARGEPLPKPPVKPKKIPPPSPPENVD